MKNLEWYLGSLAVSAMLLAPLGVRAAGQETRHEETTTTTERSTSDPAPQETTHEKTTTTTEKRYYDSTHKDYHPWTEQENKTYRTWIETDKHEKYRDFEKLKPGEQTEYWNYRHEEHHTDSVTGDK